MAIIGREIPDENLDSNQMSLGLVSLGDDSNNRSKDELLQQVLAENKEMRGSVSSILLRLSEVEAALALSGKSEDLQASRASEKSQAALVAPDKSEEVPVDPHDDPTIGVDFEYGVEASLWDATLLLGQNMGYLDIVWQLGLLFLYFLVMLSMVYVIADGFASNPYSDTVLDRLRFWRATMGHNVIWVDTYDSSSLASRVCSDDPALTLAMNQQHLNAVLLSYIAPSYLSFLQSGTLMCICSVMIYVIIIFNDCQSVIYGQLAVWNVRSSRGTQLDMSDPSKLVLASVSNFRCGAFLVVSLARIAFNCILLFFGCEWLAYTTAISDLLLNTTALTFLLDIDGIIFELAAPRALRANMETLEPMAMPRFKGRRFIPLFFLALTFAATGYFTSWLKDLTRQMDDAHEILCGGNTDFVASVSSQIGVHWAHSKPYDPDQSLSSWANGLYYSVQSVIHQDDGLEKLTFSLPTVGSVMSIQAETVAEYPKGCADVTNSTHVGARLYTVSNNITMKDYTDCASFRWYCRSNEEGATLVRVLCPVTCNCFMPDSALVYLREPLNGCPSGDDCQYSAVVPAIQKYFQGRYCLDAELDALQSTTMWNQTLEVIAGGTRWLGKTDAVLASTQLGQLGCQGLRNLSKKLTRTICGGKTLPFLCPVTCEKLAKNTCNCNPFYSNSVCKASDDCPPACAPCKNPPCGPDCDQHTPYDPIAPPINSTCWFEAQSPSPSPSTPAPSVVESTIEAMIEVFDPTTFDLQAYIDAVKTKTGASTTPTAVLKAWEISLQYVVPSGTTEIQLKTAIANAINVPSNVIEMVMAASGGRRLNNIRRLAANADVTITTDTADKAKSLQTLSGGSAAVASLKSELGGDVTVSKQPKAMAKVETKITTETSKVNNLTAQVQSVGPDVGGTITANDISRTQESSPSPSAPSPSPSSTTASSPSPSPSSTTASSPSPSPSPASTQTPSTQPTTPPSTSTDSPSSSTQPPSTQPTTPPSPSPSASSTQTPSTQPTTASPSATTASSPSPSPSPASTQTPSTQPTTPPSTSTDSPSSSTQPPSTQPTTPPLTSTDSPSSSTQSPSTQPTTPAPTSTGSPTTTSTDSPTTLSPTTTSTDSPSPSPTPK